MEYLYLVLHEDGTVKQVAKIDEDDKEMSAEGLCDIIRIKKYSTKFEHLDYQGKWNKVNDDALSENQETHSQQEIQEDKGNTSPSSPPRKKDESLEGGCDEDSLAPADTTQDANVSGDEQ